MGFFDSVRKQLAVQAAPVRLAVDIPGGGRATTVHHASSTAEIVLADSPVRARVVIAGTGTQLRGEQREPEALVIDVGDPPMPEQRVDGAPAAKVGDVAVRRTNPLRDAPIDPEAAVDLAHVQVVSAHGDLAANEEQRKLLCLLSDGRLLVAAGGDRYSHHVLSYITLLERRGIQHTPVQTRPARIIALYERAGVEVNSSAGKASLNTRAKATALKIIAEATEATSSDIHLQVMHDHATLKFRIDGDLEDRNEFDAELGIRLVRTFYQVLADLSGETFKENERLDARIGRGPHLPPGLDGVRIATTPTAERTKMVLRLLYSTLDESFDLGDLGFAAHHCEAMDELKELPIGMNIISGPTGSGKSTTLQRTLRGFIDQTQGTKHVITVEDPPEYPIPGAVQTPVGNASNQAERAEMFTAAIGSAMRLDPDVIMIGEVRDLPSAELSLRAATTGHQVWTTLHANNALHCVDRLVNMGMDKDMLLDHTVLTGLVSQRLVRKLCPHCKEPLRPDTTKYDGHRLNRLRSIFDGFDGLHVTGSGCKHCRGGTAGRTVVLEIVRPNARLCELLREGKRVEARSYWLRDLGGKSFMQHAIDKIRLGMIDPFAAIKVLGPLMTDTESLNVQGGSK